MDANKLSTVSQADTAEKIGEFWDSHDFTDFDHPDAPDVTFEITCTVPIESELFAALEKQARQRGVQVETLVNLWLQQKLSELMQQTAA
jgi:hypothetical protein